MQTANEIVMELIEAFGRDEEDTLCVLQARRIAEACERASAAWCDSSLSFREKCCAVNVAMTAFEAAIGGYGVEGIAPRDLPDSALRDFMRDYVDYVNRGDPYRATLLFDHMTGEFHVTGWGDYIEALEQETTREYTGEDGDESYDDYMTERYGRSEWMEGEEYE